MKNKTTNVGISLETIGFICWLVFLILKLNHVIDWNWFWVWFPLWSPIVLDMLFGITTIILLTSNDE